MKIYDCFTFYNELDLLEVRLAELYEHVDHFVIVEAPVTFTNRPKPLHFIENAKRFGDYLDKIIHVSANGMPKTSDPWDNERYQRNAILDGLSQELTRPDPDDIIIISDCDEILRGAAVDHMRNSEQSLFALRMPLFNFKFNYMRTNPGQYDIWGMAARYSAFDDITPDTLRNMRFSFFDTPYQFVNDGCETIEHAGWHFGYLGDREYLIDKAQSFSHQEVNNPEFIAQIDPEASIEKGTSWLQTSQEKYQVVELDDYLPACLTRNKDYISKYLLDNATDSAYNLLPPYPYQ